MFLNSPRRAANEQNRAGTKLTGVGDQKTNREVVHPRTSDPRGLGTKGVGMARDRTTVAQFTGVHEGGVPVRTVNL